jgi:phage shock protein A
MGIFDRMGKVISSNVNTLLDRAEDDKKLIELTVDQMEEQLRRGRQDVISAVASEKQLRKRVADLKADVERWDRRAELAVKAGDEALARDALKQKKRVSIESEAAEKARQEQAGTALSMKSELERMEQKLDELRLRKGTLAARSEQAKGGGGAEGLGARGGSNAFEEFRQMEEKISGREAENAAMAEVEDALGKGQRSDDLEAKFRELERGTGGATGGTGTSPDIEDELAALKKRVRVT